MKRTLKKLGLFFGVLLIVFVIVGGCFYVCNDVFDVPERYKVIANADEASPSAQSNYDSSQYPSANLLDYNNCGFVNCTLFIDDDKLEFKATDLNARFHFWFDTTIGQSYTISLDFIDYGLSNAGHFLRIGSTDHPDFTEYESVTLAVPYTFVATSTRVYIKQYVCYSYRDTMVTFEGLRVNAGSTAYPYIPNLDTVYSQGAADAWDENLGVLNGVSLASCIEMVREGEDTVAYYDTFDDSYLDVHFDSISLDFLYELSNGAVESGLYTSLCYATLTFKEPFLYLNHPLYISSPITTVGDLPYVTIITPKGDNYLCQLTYYEPLAMYKLSLSSASTTKLERLQVSAIKFTTHRGGRDFEDLSIVNGARYFNFDDGYDVAYQNGYEAAFNKQAEAGELSDGIRAFLYSLFDAPVDTFMGVFDFTVDGFDVGALVGFILTMAVVIFLVKLLV